MGEERRCGGTATPKNEIPCIPLRLSGEWVYLLLHARHCVHGSIYDALISTSQWAIGRAVSHFAGISFLIEIHEGSHCRSLSNIFHHEQEEDCQLILSGQ